MRKLVGVTSPCSLPQPAPEAAQVSPIETLHGMQIGQVRLRCVADLRLQPLMDLLRALGVALRLRRQATILIGMPRIDTVIALLPPTLATNGSRITFQDFHRLYLGENFSPRGWTPRPRSDLPSWKQTKKSC